VIRNQDGSVSGFDVDLLSLINHISGTQIRLRLGQWSVMLQQAKQREIVGLAVSVMTQKRAEHFLATDVYASEFIVILTAVNSTLALNNVEEQLWACLQHCLDLYWFYEDKPTKLSASMTLPTASQLQELYKLAKSARIPRILELLDELAKDYPEFTAQVKTLANDFDSGSLVTLLQRYLDIP